MFDGRLVKYDNKVPRYFTIDDDTAMPTAPSSVLSATS